MNQNFTKIELYLSRLLVFSVSVLWYPIGSADGPKMHHVVIVVLTLSAIISGNLIRHIYQAHRENPILIIGLFGWLASLIFMTLLHDTTWSTGKVISFFLQVIVGNFAVYIILDNGNMNELKRILNFSLLFFMLCFFLLSGIPISEIVDIFIRTVVTANPKIILVEFMLRAPLFQSFSADGLDGLRHTISMYFVLALLVNSLEINTKVDTVIIVFLALAIAIFQSRSAYLALLIPVAVVFFIKNTFIKRTLLRWYLFVTLISSFSVLAVAEMGPIILARVAEKKSYSERLLRIDEALSYLNEFSLVPITMNRTFGSSHMFIFDTYFSGGIVAFAFGFMVVFGVVLTCLPGVVVKNNAFHLGFIFGFPLLVRLFTAGSGLPGLGATLGLSIALYLNFRKRLG